MTLPPWFKKNPKTDLSFSSLLKNRKMPTVCEEAKCPNRFECFRHKIATVLALGKVCTRNCLFCQIGKREKKLLPPDPQEPSNIASFAKDLSLKHLVITMTTRDDLKDGGSSHLISIVRALRKASPLTSLELLTSDFQGNFEALFLLLQEKIDLFGHNLETVKRMSKKIRPMASYERSLEVLHFASSYLPVKSGLMVGLGEKKKEVFEAISDLIKAGSSVITIGQYLPPSSKHLRPSRYVTLEEFGEYKSKSTSKVRILAGPFIRSSYQIS